MIIIVVFLMILELKSLMSLLILLILGWKVSNSLLRNTSFLLLMR
jgi:hypothetical protein